MMQEKINNSADKKIHELKSNEFISFDDYIAHRGRFDRYKLQGLGIPHGIKQEIDDCVFPVGCKLWRLSGSEIDISVFVLKEFNLNTANIRSQKYPESQEHLLGRNARIDFYADLYASGEQFPALIGYQKGNDIYLVDGNRRFLAAKKANIQTIKVFVEEINNSKFTKNRSEFVADAVRKGISVDPIILDEVSKLKSGQESRTLFKYSEKRRNEYPSVGDQLDAIHKFLRNDTSELQAIWNKIDGIKGKYPKE